MAVELVQSTEPQKTLDLAALHASDVFHRLVFIRANLPKKLASLIEAGDGEKAIAAMLAWGKGTKPIEAIWQDVDDSVSGF